MPLPAIPIAYELVSLLVLAVGAAIAAKPRNNNSLGSSSSANDVFGDLSDIFSSEPPSGVLCCGKKSDKLETPIHLPDTRPYVNPPYYDNELNAYIHPMQPDEDLDNYTYIRPGVYYDPETGRYVTPIHQKGAADLVYNAEWEIPKNVTDKFPSDWGAGKPNKKGVGTRWKDPVDKGNRVRIDKGNPSSSFPSQQVDHVVVNSNGRVIGRDGQPINGPIKDNYDQAHIPLSEYKNWKKWDSPL